MRKSETISTHEARTRLGVSLRQVHRFLRDGSLDAEKDDGQRSRWRVTVSSVDALVARRKSG